MLLHVAHISLSLHGRLLLADGIPCMLNSDRVELQHNVVAAQGVRLVVYTPVCTAMAHTAAKREPPHRAVVFLQTSC